MERRTIPAILLSLFAIVAIGGGVASADETLTIGLKPGQHYDHRMIMLNNTQVIVNYTMTVRPHPVNYSGIDVYFLDYENHQKYAKGLNFTYFHPLTVLNTTGVEKRVSFYSHDIYYLVFDNTEAGTPPRTLVVVEFSVDDQVDYSDYTASGSRVFIGGFILMVVVSLIIVSSMVFLERKDRSLQPDRTRPPHPPRVIRGIGPYVSICFFVAVGCGFLGPLWLSVWGFYGYSPSYNPWYTNLAFYGFSEILYVLWIFGWVYLWLFALYRKDGECPQATAAGLGTVIGGIAVQPLLVPWLVSRDLPSDWAAVDRTLGFMFFTTILSVMLSCVFFYISNHGLRRNHPDIQHKSVLKFMIRALIITVLVSTLSSYDGENGFMIIFLAPMFLSPLIFLFWLYRKAVLGVRWPGQAAARPE